MPMALQRAFRQADRFVDQFIAQASSDCFKKGVIGNRATSNRRKTLESCLSIWFKDDVVKARNQQ